MNRLITKALDIADITPLLDFPPEVLTKYERELVEWIVDYNAKYDTPPLPSRLSATFPYFIPISLEGDEKTPVGDIFDETLSRKMKEYFVYSLQEALTRAKDGGDILDDLAEIQRVSSSASGITRFSTFDRREYYRGTGLKTGFRLIDRATGGVCRGEVMTLVGRLGTGKTTLSLFIAYEWWKQGLKILFVSNEMLASDIYSRLDGMLGEFNPLTLRTSTKEDVAKISKRSTSKLPTLAPTTGEIIVSKSRLSRPSQIFSLAESLQVDAVIIDGLYLMKSDEKFTAKWEKVAQISNETKDLALQTELPVVSVTQLKRTGGKKDTYDPEDIAYSDAIGQDSDFVVAINPMLLKKTRMELQLIKNRFGPEVSTIVDVDYDKMTAVEESVASEFDGSWGSKAEEEVTVEIELIPEREFVKLEPAVEEDGKLW